MIRGKYSPTVSIAYSMSQDWWKKFAGDNDYDPEGYNSYGYNKYDRDRAGLREDEYFAVPLDEDVDEDNYRDIDETFEDICYDVKVYGEALVGRLYRLDIL